VVGMRYREDRRELLSHTPLSAPTTSSSSWSLQARYERTLALTSERVKISPGSQIVIYAMQRGR